MTQNEAISKLEDILGRKLNGNILGICTGVASTCPIDECILCGTRDCPDNEPLHYHHDGCPSCDKNEF